MKKTKKMRTMAVYELLENQMTFLAAIFGTLSIICGILAFQYSKKKDTAEQREMSWTDNHKNEAAVRFQFHDGNQDLGFLYATLHLQEIKENREISAGSINILAKEAEIYLKPGNYRVTVVTREFQDKIIDVNINEEDIQQRKWYSATLRKK